MPATQFTSTDKRPVSRGCCLLAVLGLLALALLPCFAITLAMQKELVWKRGAWVEDRVWLVNETDAAGLAYSATRLLPTRENRCARTTVIFFLWKGSSDNTQYCECYTPTDPPTYLGACPTDY